MSCQSPINVCMYAGDDLRVVVEVTDENNLPIDLTDATGVTYKVAAGPSSVPIITKTLGAGISVVPPGDSFQMVFTPADTTALDGRYYHEAEFVSSTGKTYTIMSGYLTVKPTLIG